MNKPWLSVLIPTYNGEKYLSEALDSVALQNDEDIECIAVDDGSADSTVSILNSYVNKIPFRIIKQSHGGNWAESTNRALSIAQGEYVSILHQDDIWLDGRSRTIKNIIKHSPQINMILHPSWFINHKGKRLGLWHCPLPAYPALIEADTIIERLIIQNFISMPAPIFKRDIAMKVGGLDKDFWYTPDWDFWLKLSAFGKIIYYPGPLSAFRIHSSAQTVMRSDNIQNFRKELEMICEKHLRLWNIPEEKKDITWRVAFFSIEANIFFASVFHKLPANPFRLLLLFILLGPLGWNRYIRDSRILERLYARIRVF